MPDDGLREFPLNGKQLVFLFMSATVVAVVIFLCGVMVGRGVRLPAAEEPSMAAAPAADPTAVALVAAPPESSEAPATSGETLTYPTRLELDDLPVENLKATAPVSPATAVARTPAPPAERLEPPVAMASASSSRAEPAGSGFVVQVAAVRGRGEADTIARRLTGKGYPAFVAVAGRPAARVFRVRVGKYPDRREAQEVAGRLEREEQFKPWITR